jgi:hypothetical protein
LSYPPLPDGQLFDPSEWELVEERKEPARGRTYRGGWSIETVYKHVRTGALVTRHRIEKSGRMVHDHFRPGGLKAKVMSTQPKELTTLHEQIIDALANDYEDLQQIRGMLNAPESTIKSALWQLICEGYVACYQPTKTELKPVAHPDRQQLDNYWFALTPKGEQLLIGLETTPTSPREGGTNA